MVHHIKGGSDIHEGRCEDVCPEEFLRLLNDQTKSRFSIHSEAVWHEPQLLGGGVCFWWLEAPGREGYK